VNDTDVIAALATPNGKSALAIIRVSGKESHNIVVKSIKEADKFVTASFNKIYRYHFIEKNQLKIIDDITAIKYLGPKSYTGENMVEIITHGNKLLINEIFNELKKNGARIAGKGEYTRRAFLNRKLDLINAENILEKINYTNELQKRICNNIQEKKYEQHISKWQDEIKGILVTIETEIEFNEYVKINNNDKAIIETIKKTIKKEKEVWEKVRVYNKEIKIVIAGPSNVGKSSLFNKIIGYNRAIVTEIPGTTRDTISETIIIDNNEIELIDSAGIRETIDIIENVGINRSKKEIKEATIVLWVNSIDQKRIDPPDEIKEKSILIINKIDLNPISEDTNEIKISIEKEINIDSILEEIKKRINKIQNIEIPEIIANERQFQIIEKVIEYLSEAIEVWNEKEQATYFLYKTLDELEEIIGKRGKEDIYNEIFSKFCIGK
jgi:tRNA modification GTPase